MAKSNVRQRGGAQRVIEFRILLQNGLRFLGGGFKISRVQRVHRIIVLLQHAVRSDLQRPLLLFESFFHVPAQEVRERQICVSRSVRWILADQSVQFLHRLRLICE